MSVPATLVLLLFLPDWQRPNTRLSVTPARITLEPGSHFDQPGSVCAGLQQLNTDCDWRPAPRNANGHIHVSRSYMNTGAAVQCWYYLHIISHAIHTIFPCIIHESRVVSLSELSQHLNRSRLTCLLVCCANFCCFWILHYKYHQLFKLFSQLGEDGNL